MKKLKLRIANNVDTSRVFSASLKGGVRGEGDCMALETHSNNVVPCVKTLMNWIVICEPLQETKDLTKQSAKS